MSLTVRLARLDELPACSALYESVAARFFHWEPAGHRTAESMLARFEGEAVFVAHDDDRLVGFLAFYAPDNFIHSLFVEPQGRGVGPALIAAAQATATGPMSLKCEDQNVAARRFYARAGFEPREKGSDGPGRSWTRLWRAT